MRVIILLLIGVTFAGCSKYNFNILDLKHEIVKFENLPKKVQNFYQTPSDFGEDNPSLINFACIDCTFTLETIDTWYGPWVDYYKLTNQENKISYRINQGTPIPFVVYEKNLYLVDKFNIFTNVKDFYTIELTRYELK